MAKKILHIISTLEPGGVEKWLVDLISEDKHNSHEVLCISGKKGSWFNKVDNAYVKPNLITGRLSFLLNVRSFIKTNNYAIVHCHLYRFSAVIKLFSFGVNKIFIAHSHNDKRHEVKRKLFFKRLLEFSYTLFCQVIFKLTKTTNLAASNDAGIDLFGKINRFSIIHCGVDLGVEPDEQPTILDKKNKHFVTVGSLSYQKNHEFIIRIFHRLDETYQLSIIGEGKRRGELQNLIDTLELTNRVHLVGVKDEIINTLRNYTGFLFPSRYEGLGLSFVEAQAAGLACIISEKIPQEADVVEDNIKRLPIDDEEAWVSAIKGLSTEVDVITSYRKCIESDFNIILANKKLTECYEKI